MPMFVSIFKGKIIFFILSFLLLLSACKPELEPIEETGFNWTECEKRQYFQDSIAYVGYYERSLNETDSLNIPSVFFREMYGLNSTYRSNTTILYALEESFIDTSKVNDSLKFLRITVNPTFQIPYGIILKQTNHTSKLIGKMTDGNGGYYPGSLDVIVEQKVQTEYVNKIFERLENLDFFNLPSNIETEISDGQNWRFELIKDGKYYSLTRHVPQYGDSTSKELYKLGMELRDTSKLFEFWMVQSDSSKAFQEWVTRK